LYQESESSHGCNDNKQKKLKKKGKLVNDTAQKSTEMNNSVQESKNINPTKSDKSIKTFTAGEAGNAVSAGPKAGRKKRNRKKKPAANCVVDEHKVNPAKNSGVDAVEGNTVGKNSSRLANDDLIESSVQSLAEDGNKRKRKNNDEGNGKMNSRDNAAVANSSKKLKTDDATCESHIPSAAFESYRISQSMANNLRCMWIFLTNLKTDHTVRENSVWGCQNPLILFDVLSRMCLFNIQTQLN